MVDLNDLMVFLKVVKHSSYTAAAKELGLPKSNISRKITRLEKSIGLQLLERTTRNVSPTEIGETYYQYCVRINEELAGLAQFAAHDLNIAAGVLKIGCSVSIGQELLAFHLSQFRKKYPLINLKLVLTNRIIDIENEDFDVVIKEASKDETISNISFRKLLDSQLQLYAHSDYLSRCIKQGKALNNVTDLIAFDCLCLNTYKRDSAWQLLENGAFVEVAINSAVSSNDNFVLKTMAEQGLGIALLPDYFVEPEFTELNRVLPNVAAEKVSICAFYKKREYISPKVAILLDYLSDNLA